MAIRDKPVDVSNYPELPEGYSWGHIALEPIANGGSRAWVMMTEESDGSIRINMKSTGDAPLKQLGYYCKTFEEGAHLIATMLFLGELP